MPGSPTSPNPDLTIVSLKGGMNDTLSPLALAEDQCTYAANVEFFSTPCGERRNGCEPVDVSSAGFAGLNAVVHLSEWSPTGDSTDTEWFAVAGTVNGAVALARRARPSQGGAWTQITPADPILTKTSSALGLPNLYRIVAQPSEGLIPLNFFAYPGAKDRLKVWDGTHLRLAGMGSTMGTPTAVDIGSGSYSGVRYFRVRFVELDATGRILRRGEPSTTVTFTPSASGVGTNVFRPNLIGEYETHWELEAAADNATFYRIATVPVGQANYVDQTASALTYATLGPLSETIGNYLPFPSVAYLAIDGDRLLGAGHQTDQTRMSSVYWSPVFTDPGVGNNERLPLSVNNTLNLDNGDGGPITGITSGLNGIWYVFKWSRIYQMIRTNDISKAYDVNVLSTTQGALPGSVVMGQDEYGNPCVYYLDPYLGPCRITSLGIRVVTGLRTTWTRINIDASGIIAHGTYYPYKQQVIWWLAADGHNTPSLGFRLQVTNIRRRGIEDEGCWALITGRMAQAYCSTVLTEPVSVNGVVTLSRRPFIGLSSPDFLQRCDVDSTDAGVTYQAKIITGPRIPTGLLARWGVGNVTVATDANEFLPLKIQLIRDLGVEVYPAVPEAINLNPVGSETVVIRDLDDLHLSSARLMQVQLSD